MTTKIIVLVSVLLIECILALIGLELKKKEKEVDFVLSKEEFPFSSFRLAGYGIVRIIPGLSNIKDIKSRQIYYAQDKNIEYAFVHWRACIANAIAGFFLITDINLFFAVILKFKKVPESDANLLFVVLLIAAIAIFFGSFKRITDRENQKIERMLDELPNAINKMIIFLETGMPMVKVIEKLGSTEVNNPLYDEFRYVKTNVENSMPMKQALALMKERCKCSEMSRFYVILEQNLSKGTANCDLALTELALELWKGKNERIKRRGADISQKLLIPTFMQFAATMIISIVPAFFLMGGF